MPNGKPANTRCIQLNDDNLCKIFGQESRPKVCSEFMPDPAVCGVENKQAMDNLIFLESET